LIPRDSATPPPLKTALVFAIAVTRVAAAADPTFLVRAAR
jgi:hypothetical protein